ncbi:MAG: energy transducer TonB [Prevotellaceae bacterium]|jgi:protein TonB|nr:energy transducer TonB [Prevotellaceae bacterium]
MTEKKRKHFLNQPTYLGGNKDLSEFISKNLQYPEQALQNNISGSVHLQYVVNDDGIVESVQVLKGLGYGCDEEAVRVVKLLKFGKVKNRGVRLKSTKKITINFNKIIKKQELIYNLKREDDKSTKINYTIKIQ